MAFTGFQRGAVHCISWSEKTNNLCTFHHSFVMGKRLAQPDPPWHSHLVMQHRVPSHMELTLLTRHCSPITQSETWDCTALGHKYTFFLPYWWRTKAVCLTDLLSLRAEVEKTHQLSDLALIICLFRGTERRSDRWASTNGWLGAKRGRTTKEMEKITPSLRIYCFCCWLFPSLMHGHGWLLDASSWILSMYTVLSKQNSTASKDAHWLLPLCTRQGFFTLCLLFPACWWL